MWGNPPEIKLFFDDEMMEVISRNRLGIPLEVKLILIMENKTEEMMDNFPKLFRHVFTHMN